MYIRNTPYVIIILTLIYKASCERTDLTFVIDDSLSMGDDIKIVRDSVLSVAKIVLKEELEIENVVLVTFNDTEAKVWNSTVTPTNLMTSLNKVTPINKDYNYECPENSLFGVKLALESSLPESKIFVFTDASANDYRKIGWIQKLCKQKQSQVVLVLTGDCNRPRRSKFQVYYDIATACSGFAFRVNKEDIKEVYPAISESIKDTRAVLTAVTLRDNRTEVPFQIIEDYEYVIVSACGINVSLNIRGPSSETNMEKITWTKHAKVVKIKDPVIGSHMATVRAANATSVVVAGWTNFYFRHGFSENVPMSLEETETEIYMNTLTHLSLLVTHKKYTLKMASAQILNMKGNVIMDLPLKEIKPNFYTTLFQVPDDTFRIAIKGVVAQTEKPVRRIAKYPVTPQTPQNYISGYGPRRNLYLRENSSTTLKCPLAYTGSSTVMWLMNGQDVVSGPYLSLKDLENNDEGNYTCRVTDARGSAVETYVIHVGNPPTFIYDLVNVTWIRNAEDYLRCDVEARPSATVEWTCNNKPLIEKSFQLRIFEEGFCKCKVSNVHGTVSKDFKITTADS